MKKVINTSWHIFLVIYYKLAFYTGGLIDDEYYVAAGNNWVKLNNYERAISNYKMALKTEDISFTRNMIGWCYLKLRKYEEACLHYNKAYEKKNDIIHLIGVAYCKHYLGKSNEAKSILNDIKTNNKDINQDNLEDINQLEEIIVKT